MRLWQRCAGGENVRQITIIRRAVQTSGRDELPCKGRHALTRLGVGNCKGGGGLSLSGRGGWPARRLSLGNMGLGTRRVNVQLDRQARAVDVRRPPNAAGTLMTSLTVCGCQCSGLKSAVCSARSL